jgi:hypothetical protein
LFSLFRHSLKQEREKNLLLNKKLLDHYLFTNLSDLQILPTYNNDLNNSNMGFLSPTHSINVPQHHNISTPNNNSRMLLVNSPNTPVCSINLSQSITSPAHCGSFAMKQQVKLAGSNMFRYYSSII